MSLFGNEIRVDDEQMRRIARNTTNFLIIEDIFYNFGLFGGPLDDVAGSCVWPGCHPGGARPA
jgi:hypothetical protein